MPQAIVDRIRSVHPGAFQEAGGLRVVPITGPSQVAPVYDRLGPDTVRGVQVKEVSDAGSVPELIVENTLDVRIYLMDGQELLGAKQNRILNTDVLVPAKSTITIPVSCVEQGRWSRVSVAFMPGKAATRRTRVRKMTRVRESLSRSRGFDAGQHDVWDEVECCRSVHAAPAPTAALADVYRHRQAELEAARAALTLPEDAVGLAVFRGGDLLGIDVFDRHATCRWYWESLLDSYLIDVGGDDTVGEPSIAQSTTIEEALAHVSDGTWTVHDSPGEGRDHRLVDDRFEASALVWDDRCVIHLQLFPKERPSQARDGDRARRRRNLDRLT